VRNWAGAPAVASVNLHSYYWARHVILFSPSAPELDPAFHLPWRLLFHFSAQVLSNDSDHCLSILLSPAIICAYSAPGRAGRPADSVFPGPAARSGRDVTFQTGGAGLGVVTAWRGRSWGWASLGARRAQTAHAPTDCARPHPDLATTLRPLCSGLTES
jgi:hypothetical protein